MTAAARRQGGPSMMFTGVAICARRLADGIGELCFDRRDESVNKFDRTTIAELRRVLAAARALDLA